MATIPLGRASLDGIDLSVFGVGIENSDELLKFPERKEAVVYDWQDSNGVEVDLSRVFFKDRDINLKMIIYAETGADFWNKYNMFLAQLAKPYTRRLEISYRGESFQVYYKSCSTFASTVKPEAGIYAGRFTILVNQPNPQINNKNVYIVTEAGRFFTT